MSPAQARFTAALMAVLSLLAFTAAGIQGSQGSFSTAGLFLLLGVLGAWQMVYYHRLK